MKKFGFAIQVFGIIAMLPVCVILEMNHNIAKFGSNKMPSGNKRTQEKAISKSSTNRSTGFETPGDVLTIVKGI